MTNATDTIRTGATRPLRRSRPANTLLLRQLMEQQQRTEMGERIALLRERSPWSQAEIADKLGYKNPRGYQKLEERGTTKFEYCEKLAKIHAGWTTRSAEWVHVNAEWIWGGEQSDKDLLGQLSAQVANGDHEKLLQILAERVMGMGAELEGAVGLLRTLATDLKSVQADLAILKRRKAG